jgi:uncharacterized protein (DUF3084 family)
MHENLNELAGRLGVQFAVSRRQVVLSSIIRTNVSDGSRRLRRHDRIDILKELDQFRNRRNGILTHHAQATGGMPTDLGVEIDNT